METRLAMLCRALAFAAAFAACHDSSTAPARRAATGNTPNFVTTAGQTTQFHFVSNGDFGDVSWFTSDPSGGFTFGFLNVSLGGPTNNRQTFLFYFVFQCDPFFFCDIVQGGSGLIPNKDLSGGGKLLRLSTNTSGNPNFFIFAGTAGLVSVDWRTNGLFSQRSSGTNQFSFGSGPDTLAGFTHRSQGSFTSASATATGSVVGVPISPGNFGSIGTNHNVTIDIFR